MFVPQFHLKMRPLPAVILQEITIFLIVIVIVACNNKNLLVEAEEEIHIQNNKADDQVAPTNETVELPKPLLATAAYIKSDKNIFYNPEIKENTDTTITQIRMERSRRPTLMDIALQTSAREGLQAMTEMYGKILPDILKNGQLLDENHPAALLSKFSASNGANVHSEMAAFATLSATKAFRKNYKYINELARQAHSPKISLRRTALEGLCPPRDPPACMPASERYRTHDGTCNNKRRLRWGASQMPFNRFLPPEYGDGVDSIRTSIEGVPLSSSRFVSLLVHGARDGEAGLTLMTAQWGQLLDHDMTSTAQPRPINGSVPSCCGSNDFHPSCFPIKVPLDDPWLAPLKVRCLEFLRSAPAQRRDCVLSWREQTNQATSYIDASPIYSNSAKSSDNARIFRKGLLIFGRGNPADDVCQRGAISTQCIRAGDGRSGEQPGLLALHHVWVGEHNRIAIELSEMNLHWSDEKIFQETRRIIGAMFQHITYREFLPIILGREVGKLFDLDLQQSGYFEGYDPKVNPTVANSFAAAAFRFGHSLIQNSYIRCDRHHNVVGNNVSLHEEFQRGDIGSAGSLHRLLRGLATQRALKRDEFITPELTNHLFQTPGFPFGLDLAAINIQRGRDHGIPAYTAWRIPCGLSAINNWDDFANVVGPESAKRIGHAYRSVHDIDLFVGGIAERPVIGGLVGPTFACIIAQQFSNSRKGDRFWYENGGFESSFTPAQLHSLRRVSLAQVLCRTVGGGTFQPHIFLPPEFNNNERISCGVGSLAPIDLTPWLEQDPFDIPAPQPTFSSHIPERIFEILPTDLTTNKLTTVEFLKENSGTFSNGSIREELTNFIPNASKVSDKLDLKTKKGTITHRTTKTPAAVGVNNKLDKNQKITLNIKNVNRHHIQSQIRKKVVLNNIPVELRSASEGTAKDTKLNDETTNKLKNTTDSTNKTTKNNTFTRTEKLEPRIAHEESDKIKLAELSNAVTNKHKPRLDDQERTDIHKWKFLSNSVTDSPENDDDSVTIAEEDIFDIFSTLTEPTVASSSAEAKLTTTEETTMTQFDEGIQAINNNLTEIDKYENVTDIGNLVALNNTKITTNLNGTKNTINDTTNEDSTGIYQKVNNTVNFNNSTIDETLNIDSAEIDPLTHSPSYSEHKRVQRGNDPLTYRENRKSKNKNRAFSTIKTTSTVQQNNSSNIIIINKSNNTLGPKIKNRNTTKTPRPPTGITKSTKRNVELRQYHTQTVYTRPQKVILDGPNADQYEIEINIRQTNKNSATGPIVNYADYTTVYKPYGSDRYSPNYAGYNKNGGATTQYGYYQSPPTLSSTHRTRPPTIIYLNEHGERTTTRQPGFLQNFITFATSGHQTPVSSNANKDKPSYQPSLANSPHSSNLASSHYIPRPSSQTSGQLSPTSSFSQINGVGASNGVVHASSSAVSSGNFGSIVGVASANGADSTFSFNIRHRPQGSLTSVVPKPDVGSYGLLPPRKSLYGHVSTTEYAQLPLVTAQTDTYYEPDVPYRESSSSPFSTAQKRPQDSNYFARIQNNPQQKEATNDKNAAALKLDIADFDYSSRTLDTKGNFSKTTDKSIVDVDEAELESIDDYDYNDEYEDSANISLKKYSKDGYLRPQHMLANLFKTPDKHSTNETKNNSTLLDDNFVLPVLNSDTQKTITDTSTVTRNTEFTHTTNIVTNFPDAFGKHLSNDILAEDETTEQFIGTNTAEQSTTTTTEKTKLTSMAFAPLKILTKPERPDNWVIFDTPRETPLLPDLPAFNAETITTGEIPMPLGFLKNSWWLKYINKDLEMTETNTKTNTEISTDSMTDANNDTTMRPTTMTTIPPDLYSNEHVIEDVTRDFTDRPIEITTMNSDRSIINDRKIQETTTETFFNNSSI